MIVVGSELTAAVASCLIHQGLGKAVQCSSSAVRLSQCAGHASPMSKDDRSWPQASLPHVHSNAL